MDKVVLLFKDMFARFFRNGGFFLAAAVAFFAAISVFPLLLLGFIILLTFVRAGVAESTILAITNNLIPNGSVFLQEIIHERVAATSAGIFGILALVYAGMAVFGALQFALDRSFETKAGRTYGRFLFTSLVMSLITGAIIVTTGLFRIGTTILAKKAATAALASFFSVLSELILFVAFFVAVTLIYTMIPMDRRSFRQIWPGAVFGSISIFIAQRIFTFWLTHTTLPFIFGSLTAVIALLLWLDVTAILILLGAELAAAWTG